MKKTKLELSVMWHISSLLHPFPVTIVTSVDNNSRINAGAFSLVLPFCSSSNNPQLLLIANSAWHTAKNIEATGEFVVNYPTADQSDDIMETARFYPEEINELDHTEYTTMPSNHVQPPLIAECFQHIECRVYDIIRPSKNQINVIADILEVSIDNSLCKLSRFEKIRVLNVPVYFCIDDRQNHIFGNVENIVVNKKSLVDM